MFAAKRVVFVISEIANIVIKNEICKKNAKKV